MKKSVLLIVLATALIASAGCIANPAEVQDPLVGNWVAGEYTNTAGMHYLKVYETFYPDNTGVEKGYIDDGSTTRWEFIWLKKGENLYEAYYNPLTFTMGSDGNSGIIDSTTTEVKDWQFVRKEGEKGHVAGTWAGKEAYSFMGGTYNVSAEIYADGTGLLIIGDDLISINLAWTQVGEGMYVITLSDTMGIELHADGTYTDSFGILFHRM